MGDIISKKEILSQLHGDTIPVYIFDEIDSTNRFAKTLNDDFALVVSDTQSMGRGRLGRSFHSPKGVGIYMSLKAKIDDLYNLVPFVTTLSAVAVHQSIKELFGADCSIKWVNDIYIGNKKVSGILCEAVDASHAVIGIGVNFYPSPLPKELEGIATSLTSSPSPVSRSILTGRICNKLLDLIRKLPDTQFIEYYKANSCVLGKRVLCIQGDASFTAVAKDIDPFGALIVETDNGLKTLSTGEITLRFTD